MGHLQRLASFDEDPVLSSNPCAHHDSCRGCQSQRAGASDGQHGDGGLEGEADDNFRLGDVLVITLGRREWLITVIVTFCISDIYEVCVGTYREVLLHNVKVDKPDHQPGHQC